MIDTETISELRQKMLGRRSDILDFRQTVNTSWQSLNEPEKELEESASKETLSRGLAQLDDRGQIEIRAIDQALTKMNEGRYGKCEACRRPIAVKRLYALPWTRYCLRCAQSRESFGTGEIASPPATFDQEATTDDDMQDIIEDALQEDGRVEMEELDITCEDGVVYLNGVLPTRLKHEILLEVIHDTLDFNEIVDNITIDRQPWERRERPPASTPEKPEKEIMMEGDDEPVDVYTSLSDGEPMTPPDALRPEKQQS
jgi:RNA polymerase-binding transcription factor DksA